MKRTYRIYRSGVVRLLNITRFVPRDWEEVLVEVLDGGEDYVVLRLRKVA